jgi:hypothetical protein
MSALHLLAGPSKIVRESGNSDECKAILEKQPKMRISIPDKRHIELRL